MYLDSAHEPDETFTELSLYYHTLAAGWGPRTVVNMFNATEQYVFETLPSPDKKKRANNICWAGFGGYLGVFLGGFWRVFGIVFNGFLGVK